METKSIAAGGITTAALTAAGIGAGAKIGQNRANKILGDIKGLTKDQYINSKVEANTDNIMSSVRMSKWNKALSKVSEKASKDFKAITAKAKQEKNKTMVALGAAGLAIGAVATAVISKINSEKNIQE